MKLGLSLELGYPLDGRFVQKGEGLLQLEQMLARGKRPVSGNDGVHILATGNYEAMNTSGSYVAKRHKGQE